MLTFLGNLPEASATAALAFFGLVAILQPLYFV
jgi:hypothetical protein